MEKQSFWRAASWWVFERLARSCKYVFYAIINTRRITDEILSDTFCLGEQSLNASTITPIAQDSTDWKR